MIGPHASNLLSELILTVVDKNLYDKDWRYIRNIDDYTCYVESMEDGQKFLLELGSELRQFDLTLNFKKNRNTGVTRSIRRTMGSENKFCIHNTT